MNFKFALESLIEKIDFTILAVLQLVISFVLIYVSIANINYNNGQLEKIDKIYPDKNYYVVDSTKMVPLEQMNLKDLREFKEFIDNEISINVYSMDETQAFTNIDNLPINNTIIAPKLFEGETFYSTEIFYMNEEYIKVLFSNYDNAKSSLVDSDSTPAVLGYNYSKMLSKGDSIRYLYTNKDGESAIGILKVVGFFEKGTMVSEKASTINVKELDNFIIIPFTSYEENIPTSNNMLVEMSEKIDIFNALTLGYYSFDDDRKVSELEQLSSAFGMNLKFSSVQSTIDQYKNEVYQIQKPLILFSACISLFTIFSVMMVMLSMVIKNTKKYGIHMLIGASIRDILFRIIIEIGILFTLSIAAALLSINILFNNDITLKLTLLNCTELIIIAIVLCFIVSLIPVIKFKTEVINNIIKRGE